MAMVIDAELARRKRKDVAVVAWDDLALVEEAPEPALTVVAQGPEGSARTADTSALTRVDSDRTRAARTVTVPPN